MKEKITQTEEGIKIELDKKEIKEVFKDVLKLANDIEDYLDKYKPKPLTSTVLSAVSMLTFKLLNATDSPKFITEQAKDVFEFSKLIVYKIYKEKKQLN